MADAVREQYNPLVRTLLTMPKPVVAAVNGIAAGAGMALAPACDIRIAASSATFTTAFAGIGLSCDTGISWILPRVAGRAAALDLLLRPRLLGAAEALAWDCCIRSSRTGTSRALFTGARPNRPQDPPARSPP